MNPFPLLATIAAATLFATPEAWHATLDAGIAAAKKSGKPLLVVTAWTNEQ